MHKKKTLNTGFTLIELLVVIAIIGVLASVILVSLNSARSKGSAAAVKATFANARVQAELFYNANNYSYSGLCGTSAVNGVEPIMKFVQSALEKTDASGTASTGGQNVTTRRAVCHASGSRYMISAPLSTANVFWCIDSTGAVMQHTTTVNSSTNYVCS